MFLEVQREAVKHGPELICDLIKDQWYFNVNLEIDVIGSNLYDRCNRLRVVCTNAGSGLGCTGIAFALGEEVLSRGARSGMGCTAAVDDDEVLCRGPTLAMARSSSNISFDCTVHAYP